MAECLVAFANGDGGLIVLGLEENGRPSQPIWDDEAESALKVAAEMCKPPVVSRWQPVETPQGLLVGIQVSRSPELHSLEDGRVLIRSGSENRLLSGSEISRLANSKVAADFEADHVAGAIQDDFDQNILDEYLARREQRGVSKVSPMSELLFEIGAVDTEGRPTVAGILPWRNHGVPPARLQALPSVWSPFLLTRVELPLLDHYSRINEPQTLVDS
jgi:ATP-dependent DNA helicase RecG